MDVLVTAILFFLSIIPAQSQQKSAMGSNRNFAALSAQADAARDGNRLDEAVALYRRALALHPSWAEGFWSLGTIEYDQEHYAQAASAFRRLIGIQTTNGTAHAMLGLCEFELGHDDAALRHIEKGQSFGLQKNPDLWQVVLYHEGILLQRKGSFQAAQDTLEELCLETGPSDNAANVLGMTMLRSSAKEPPPIGSVEANVVLSVGRAECLAGQKKYDDAKPLYDKIVAEHSDYPNVHYAYGLFLIELRDVEGAVAQMKQEIANDPKSVVARLRIAAIEFKEDSAAGIPYAEEAVKLDSESPFAHYILGLLRLDVDDFKNAIPELEIARKGMPREPKIYFALGTAYSRAGRKADAVKARVTFQKLTDESKSSTSNQSLSPSVSGENEIRVNNPSDQ